MKPVKNFLFAALLVFCITLNTLGGDIDLPGAPAPTPQPPRMTATTDETIPGTTTDSQDTDVETADYLFLEVLTALLSAY